MLNRLSILALAAISFFGVNHSLLAGDAQRTQTLVAVLKSDAAFFDKARACQQLGEVGTPEAVPVLAALLADEHLSAYARSGLEGIADPSALDALRAALGTMKGAQLRGVIDSLGVVRDAKAVAVLSKLASDLASGVDKDALLSLGRIASAEATEFLRKSLASGSDALRPEAAAACILAAEQQMSGGNSESAGALYDAVRVAKVPASYRIAAIRGAILARKDKGVALLIEQLESGDSVARLVALTTVREFPSDALAEAMNGVLAKAGPDLQSQLIPALVECHNARSLELLRAAAASENASVRETALTVLSQIGGATEAAVLVSAITANRSASEVAVATAGLRRMTAPGIDPVITHELASAKDAETRVKLIRLLGNREAASANSELLRYAADPDVGTAVAALGVLSSVAGTNDVPSLIMVTKTATDSTVRAAAETALVNTCERVGESASEAVLSELRATDDPVREISWVRILATVGYAKSLPVINSILTGTNQVLAIKVLEQVDTWPDPAPVEPLLAFAEGGVDPVRSRARSTAIQLAANAADEHQRPEPTIVAWLQRAARNAQAKDVHHVLFVLGRIKQPESFTALQPFFEDKALQVDAARAVVQIAPAIVKSAVAPALKVQLQKITPEVDAELSAQAAKIATQIP